MTLADMADFICTKVNQTDAEDIAACKDFLTQRHEMIWADQLWKDSLVEYVQTLSPDNYVASNNWLPTPGVLLLPPIIERVIAARTSASRLNVQRPEIYYRVDYDAFAKTGSPADFILLAACVWQVQATAAIAAVRGADGDAQIPVKADLLDADGVGVTRYSKTLAAANNALANSTRIDAVLKAATTGAVMLTADGVTIVTVAAADTNAKRRQRIRLVEIPTAEVPIRVLGKRSVPTFTDDLDEPAINGSTNCLLALGQADMLERERQYGKAADKMKEAQFLFEQLKAVEVVQQAHEQRIIPESGYGDDCWPDSKASF